MLKRYVVVTAHSESRTVWSVMDTDGDMECVASFSSSRGETFGDAWQHTFHLNNDEDIKRAHLYQAWDARAV